MDGAPVLRAGRADQASHRAAPPETPCPPTPAMVAVPVKSMDTAGEQPVTGGATPLSRVLLP